jgi:hypothetical protein
MMIFPRARSGFGLVSSGRKIHKKGSLGINQSLGDNPQKEIKIPGWNHFEAGGSGFTGTKIFILDFKMVCNRMDQWNAFSFRAGQKIPFTSKGDGSRWCLPWMTDTFAENRRPMKMERRLPGA